MKYKDIKIVEAEPQSVLGGTPVGRICFGLKQSSRPVTSWRNKSMMIKGAEAFIKRYPEHEAEIRACMTKYGLGGNKGTGSGSSDKGTGSGSGDKGTGSGSGDKGTGSGSGKSGDGTGSSDKGDGTGTGNKDGKGKIPGYTPPTGGKGGGTDKGTGDKSGDGSAQSGTGTGVVNSAKEFNDAIKKGNYKKAQEILDTNPKLNNITDQETKDLLDKKLNPKKVEPKKVEPKKVEPKIDTKRFKS
jgi:hypothetical protein